MKKKGFGEGLRSYLMKTSFVRSFSVDKRRFLVSVLSDIIYFGIIFIGWVYLLSIIGPKFPMVLSAPAVLSEQQVMASEGMQESEAEALYGYIDEIIAAWKTIVTYTIIALVVFILINSAFKTFSWSRLIGKSFSFPLFLRAIAMNILIFALFIGIFKYIIMPFVQYNQAGLMLAIFFIVSFIFLLVLNVLRIMLVREGKIFRSLAKSYKIIVLRFYVFIIPMLLMLLMLLPVSILAGIFRFIPFGLGVALTFILLVLYLNWCKHYFHSIVDRLAVAV
jgi:hypothetical protein